MSLLSEQEKETYQYYETDGDEESASVFQPIEEVSEELDQSSNEEGRYRYRVNTLVRVNDSDILQKGEEAGMNDKFVSSCFLGNNHQICILVSIPLVYKVFCVGIFTFQYICFGASLFEILTSMVFEMVTFLYLTSTTFAFFSLLFFIPPVHELEFDDEARIMTFTKYHLLFGLFKVKLGCSENLLRFEYSEIYDFVINSNFRVAIISNKNEMFNITFPKYPKKRNQRYCEEVAIVLKNKVSSVLGFHLSVDPPNLSVDPPFPLCIPDDEEKEYFISPLLFPVSSESSYASLTSSLKYVRDDRFRTTSDNLITFTSGLILKGLKEASFLSLFLYLFISLEILLRPIYLLIHFVPDHDIFNIVSVYDHIVKVVWTDVVFIFFTDFCLMIMFSLCVCLKVRYFDPRVRRDVLTFHDSKKEVIVNPQDISVPYGDIQRFEVSEDGRNGESHIGIVDKEGKEVVVIKEPRETRDGIFRDTQPNLFKENKGRNMNGCD